MSEQLRAKGYLNSAGISRGDVLGMYESFIVGDVTLRQLAKNGIVPARNYGAVASRKPDGLVVDRRSGTPRVRLVIEHKDRGELSTPEKIEVIVKKGAEIYCKNLDCSLLAVTDGLTTVWASTLPSGEYRMIEREDGFPLDHSADAHDSPSRKALARLLGQLDESLDLETGRLRTPAAANPTQLADKVWQAVWLASGANPDACLATFIEVLLFKFLSDLGVLTARDGIAVDFNSVRSMSDKDILVYYAKHVRPAIKAIFPPDPVDGTSVINGTVLDPRNIDHGRLFSRMLGDFEKFGSLRRISPEFKSRIFERFLRNSISQKNWGQYFTPRNVVKAMVEMSSIEHLAKDAVVCDPASGVGGFILEPLLNKRTTDFRGGPTLKYVGLDRDPKTIILAKANMLIHLSDLLEEDPSGAAPQLAKALNETFSSMDKHISGSLAMAPEEEYDLVLSNPPYVVSGTTQQKAMLSSEQKYSDYYDTSSLGIEGLFMQLMVKGLKPGGRAFVVVPDGMLFRHGDTPLRKFILANCDLEAIISLPKNTFYTTSKKTYILGLRKRAKGTPAQSNPVFTYMITNVGETLDSKRFTIDENDLPDMAQQFRLFSGNPSFYTPADKLRCRIEPISKFVSSESWLIDHWWSDAEHEELGSSESKVAVTPKGLVDRLDTLQESIDTVKNSLGNLPAIKQIASTRTIKLSDTSAFRLSIGKRVTQRALREVIKPGPVKLFSANVREPFAMVDPDTLPEGGYKKDSFARGTVIWGIDGDWVIVATKPGEEYASTDHCGRVDLQVDDLDPEYVAASIARAGASQFTREFRPSLQRMEKIEIKVPIDADGNFDLDAQSQLAARYRAVERAQRSIAALVSESLDVIPEPFDHEKDSAEKDAA